MFIVHLLLALALLSGSGSSSDTTVAQQENYKPHLQFTSPEQVLASGLKPFRPSSEIDISNPNQVEQAVKLLREKHSEIFLSTDFNSEETFDFGGQITSLNNVPVNVSFDHGSLKIHITKAQFMEASDIPEESQKNISILNQGEISSKINYLDILYSVENTSEQNIGFYGLNSVHPNTGDPISSDRNFMRSLLEYNQYDGVVIDNKNYGLVYTDEPNELQSIELVFNKVYDYETEETIAEPMSLIIPLNTEELF
ncbi:hypothetical protein ASD24_07120 [Paenibacillus sp. Root52]|uniref:Uncharacterized protein n=1 Tax=Paenibacillus amylolyticus TaxID=1451 RepID=A0AAP5LS65_PAEAM|nr:MULTISPECIES: hypothetical protein [Paenibacillus]KQY87607.1 hypothetical protein ASD24_07120 [Paenibacillus sp. Root52]MDR6725224.1 hypothetical protein [Paenibacillus amylolyticus]